MVGFDAWNMFLYIFQDLYVCKSDIFRKQKETIPSDATSILNVHSKHSIRYNKYVRIYGIRARRWTRARCLVTLHSIPENSVGPTQGPQRARVPYALVHLMECFNVYLNLMECFNKHFIYFLIPDGIYTLPSEASRPT